MHTRTAPVASADPVTTLLPHLPASGRRLPLPLALKYAIDIVKGLVELHRLGVIAADLKPDNVLIDEELGDAVIADFGISSVVTTTIGNSGVTGRGSGMRSSGAMRGTPNYM
jgi:serine/threonine protein kinase